MSITSGEKERNPLPCKSTRHRVAFGAIEIDIQDRGVEAQRRNPRERVIERRNDADDDAAEVGQHILDQHCNQNLILDDKDAQSVEPISVHRPSTMPKAFRSEGGHERADHACRVEFDMHVAAQFLAEPSLD
jgi:hypothetical protein